jgi:hypothetical protein
MRHHVRAACSCALLAAASLLALPILLVTSCDVAAGSGPAAISALGGGAPAVDAVPQAVGVAVRSSLRPLFPWTPRGGFPTQSWPFGQCTWFAVYEGHAAGNHRVIWSGNADAWYANAARAGVPTASAGTVPQAGWIAVFAPGHGSDPDVGHVAVVASVAAAAGTYTIAEMNVLGLGVVDLRTLRLGGTAPLVEGWVE